MKRVYIATIQLLIEGGIDGEPGACDWVSGLLSEHAADYGLLDWSYLKLGGQLLSPRETFVAEDYSEGDAF